LKRLEARPNGRDKLYSIMTMNFIPFQKLLIGALMIEAILDHEYSEKKRMPKTCPACGCVVVASFYFIRFTGTTF
jgi:formate dehydrogenase maturation protein FdhE